MNTNTQYMHNAGVQENNYAPRNLTSMFIGDTHSGTSNTASNNQTINAPGGYPTTTGPAQTIVNFNINIQVHPGANVFFGNVPTTAPIPTQPTAAHPAQANPTPAHPTQARPAQAHPTPTTTAPNMPTQTNSTPAPAAPNTDDNNDDAESA
ncbi:hypothetical protein BDN72DRAFT_190682 [Pluteus cervinus]|uniref:Uncharacterized protein n=1 Tax=Pluteus cervinus TaxID=181527 RepID=A0ACD3AIC8_9AGAR|nr:hypothetical protein BDN72DRAFT_190682 [Pluteus cervinus]